jgi:PleD family two-component response regulator/HPt (histidine-containing phosphotransfer) domain-containing protein
MASDEGAKICSILLLDDEALFRQTIARMLEREGYNPIEARTAKEATALVADKKPELMIVDYRLPGINGMVWLEHMRRLGVTVPVVFLSQTWLDAKTFHTLRSALGVSLILQKPVVPELFMQQIENVLPARPEARKPQPKPQATADMTTSRKLKARSRQTGGTTGSAAVDPAGKSVLHGPAQTLMQQVVEKTDQESLEKLRVLQEKLVALHEVSLGRAQYLNVLPLRVDELKQSLSRFTEQPENGILAQEARQFAHRMRTAAGSFGLRTISEAAGRIEDSLMALDSEDESSWDILWEEITRSLDEIVDTVPLAGSAAPSIVASSLQRKVLLIGDARRFAVEAAALSHSGIADAIMADSAAAAERRLKTSHADGIIIDFGMDNSDEILSFICNMRLQTAQRSVPVALIGQHAGALQRYEQLYIGSSLTMDTGADRLSACTRYLLQLSAAQNSSVLVVDADDVVTAQVSGVLSEQGINVFVLNDPLRILSEIENCHPDAILLSVDMPGMSGYDLCRLLRASDLLQKTPILMLPSGSSANARAAAYLAGANDFVTKPIVKDELVRRVMAQLKLRETDGGDTADYQHGSVLPRRTFMRKVSELHGQKGPICLALMGIKKFDVIGFRHGLRAQDSATDLAATILRSRFRYQDIRGRWSESVFAVAFPGETAEVAGAAVSLMCDEYARYEIPSGKSKTFHSAMSFGFSVQDCANLDWQKLIEAAHRNLVATAYA